IRVSNIISHYRKSAALFNINLYFHRYFENMRLSSSLFALLLCFTSFAYSQQSDIRNLTNEYLSKSKANFSRPDSSLHYASKAYQLIKDSDHIPEKAES